MGLITGFVKLFAKNFSKEGRHGGKEGRHGGKEGNHGGKEGNHGGLPLPIYQSRGA